MTGRKRPYRYQHNPKPHYAMGPKTYDDVSGAKTYEGYIVVDGEGQRVDSRYDTFDYRTGRREDIRIR